MRFRFAVHRVLQDLQLIIDIKFLKFRASVFMNEQTQIAKRVLVLSSKNELMQR